MNYDINQIKKLADAVYDDAVTFRRRLHMNPELSEHEEKTAAAICEKLDYLGIERNRTRLEWVSAAEGAKFAETMQKFTADVKKLGPNRRLEDLRCRKQ